MFRSFPIAPATIIAGCIAAVSLLIQGCDQTSEVSGENIPIVIYLVDTLRADRWGISSQALGNSPFLDEVAKNGVVFSQAYAPATWTLPSIVSLMTSTFPCENGVTHKDLALNPSLKTLPERLMRAGYVTGGFYTNPWARLGGMDRGYSTYPEENLKQNNFSKDVEKFLQGASTDKIFLYLHTTEPHDPWLTPIEHLLQEHFVNIDDRKRIKSLLYKYSVLRQADFRNHRPRGTTDNTIEQDAVIAELDSLAESFTSLYDASVRWADANMGGVIGELKEAGLWDKAIFVFISDHGDEFGEHGSYMHGQSLYEELAHVPFVMHFPGDEFGGMVIDEPVSLLDVMPTVLDYIGKPELCDGCRGKSLLAVFRNPANAPANNDFIASVRMARAWYYRPWEETRGTLNVAVRQGALKAIWNPDVEVLELYDLITDPLEQNDLSNENPEKSEELRTIAAAWLEQCLHSETPPEAAGGLDQRTREQIQALGYF